MISMSTEKKRSIETLFPLVCRKARGFPIVYRPSWWSDSLRWNDSQKWSNSWWNDSQRWTNSCWNDSRPSWWSVTYIPPPSISAIFVPGLMIQHKCIQTSFLEHFNMLEDSKKIPFVKECLLQVAKLLANMDYYVHGDLTVQNIMISYTLNRYQFYIIDRCVFDRTNYCDLRTLYISILDLFTEPFPIFFDAFTNIYLFDPILFIRHIETI